jgi:hypothetical protein
LSPYPRIVDVCFGRKNKTEKKTRKKKGNTKEKRKEKEKLFKKNKEIKIKLVSFKTFIMVSTF